jgi:hypothetical protein
MRVFKPKFVVAVEPQVDIVKGMYVMVDNGAESFWVQIANLTSTLLMGIVCTRLKKSRTYNFSDIVQFQKQNILAFL